MKTITAVAAIAANLLFISGCGQRSWQPLEALMETTPDVEGEGGRLVMVGDAGWAGFGKKGEPLGQQDPVMREVTRVAGEGPDAHTAIVFLGDNVYGRKPRVPRTYGGMRPCDEDQKDCFEKLMEDGAQPNLEEQQLLNQLAVTASGVPTYFVPGNHDWYRGAAGLDAERRMIDAYAHKHDVDVQLLPKISGRHERRCDGADAITVRKISAELALVGIDTQAQLQCAEAHQDARQRLWTTIENLKQSVVVIAGHHPVRSLGPHGTSSFRSRFTRQDIGAKRYDLWIESILRPPDWVGDRVVIYASGHDHLLQVLEPDGFDGYAAFVVSGAGSLAHDGAKTPVISPLEGDFVSSRSGFVVLDVRPGEVVLRTIGANLEGVDELHVRSLARP